MGRRCCCRRLWRHPVVLCSTAGGGSPRPPPRLLARLLVRLSVCCLARLAAVAHVHAIRAPLQPFLRLRPARGALRPRQARHGRGGEHVNVMLPTWHDGGTTSEAGTGEATPPRLKESCSASTPGRGGASRRVAQAPWPRRSAGRCPRPRTEGPERHRQAGRHLRRGGREGRQQRVRRRRGSNITISRIASSPASSAQRSSLGRLQRRERGVRCAAAWTRCCVLGARLRR